VRDRRNNSRRAGLRTAGPAGAIAAIGLRLWSRAARRPVDAMAILGAGAASAIIIVNAMLLQSSPHPAPFFANPTALPQTADIRPRVPVTAAPKPADAAAVHPAAGVRTPQAVSARRNDPIADLIAAPGDPPPRVMAVQRVLSEFGYGQLRPSGVVDQPTSAAIEKFEDDHQLPVTGRLSNRVLRELAVMTGRPIE
jgi:hypothetical protein